MRFLFACGGSGGHVNPAIAIASELRSLFPDCAILFVGGTGNVETEIVPRAGFTLRTIAVDNLRRSISPKAIAHNIRASWLTATGLLKSRRILREFRPDAVIGTGGYVCYPVLRSAASMGIPTVLHESNVMPGLTTRMLERCVDAILLGFPGCESRYKLRGKLVTTGTPVRHGFTAMESAHGAPLVLSTWGSLGAKYMNAQIPEFMRLAEADGTFRALHAAGTNSDLLPCRSSNTEIVRYIHDMPTRMSEASLVICRAGAMTLSELAASGTPSILVPSAFVTANHQEANAREFERHGAAVVILERDATAQTLFDAAKRLLSDPELLRRMGESAKALDNPDASGKIVGEILRASESRRRT
ncbi:MAG: UDP-N-acetylglucosamine--N-acetylmuramyl-(pentapeptide) pyrophosphoryl-undecaprenol N-acetylglucosamine transferase [Oscillospiraceae bacterium]|jgi:UDP-N-acetylglucosamine--N-acetylmuramyl-(pentapeptide) pyrophosphoryl-undecaprenol N-acetylglucosamine transferase|nr:UDP-N-acetylglucosamine--N-acetylmuramyl-(pentapeptide) pyrophosphoryl-undecaprenol N-acetylglucosamine transferase [Oscillospiraceae bacterium]